jgi:chromosome partitioning protein
VEAVRAYRKPLVFIINRVKPRSRLTGEAAIVLSQSGTVASVQIGDRVDYAAAKTNGLTAPEIGCTQAEQEMRELWGYVAKRLEEITNVPA